jgi:hypothetical protein
MIQDLYIEFDLTSSESDQVSAITELSEDKLVLENLSVKETLSNSLMLVSILKYRRIS